MLNSALFILEAYLFSGALFVLREKRRNGIDQSEAIASNKRGLQLFMLVAWPSLDMTVGQALSLSLPALAILLVAILAVHAAGVTGLDASLGIGAGVLLVCLFALWKRPNPQF